MRIGILGSGLMGAKLGTLFVRAGHDVAFSYARDMGKLERLAKQVGKGARAASVADAAKGAETLLLAVHWTRVDDVLAQAGPLGEKTLLSCTLPMSADDSHMVLGLATSGAEALAVKAKGAQIVSAFSTVPSEALAAIFAGRKRSILPDLVYCGGDKKAKAVAAGLIRDTGFNPVDLGDLTAARMIEPFSLLVARIAYEGGGGPELAYRFSHLKPAH